MKRTHYKPDILVAWRKASGMTQQQFADMLGIHQTTVARIERGKHFSLDYITEAARACGKDFREALTEEMKNKLTPIVKSA